MRVLQVTAGLILFAISLFYSLASGPSYRQLMTMAGTAGLLSMILLVSAARGMKPPWRFALFAIIAATLVILIQAVALLLDSRAR